MTNVQVTTGLRRQSSDHLTLDGVRKSKIERRVGARSGSSSGIISSLGGLGSLDLALSGNIFDGLGRGGESRDVVVPAVARARQS